jgi:hypothetical protein
VIEALAFAAAQIQAGRAVRRIRFEPRSTLPLSAASVVANGVREELGRLLGREFDVELIEPLLPQYAERRLLFDGAFVRRVRGRRADGFVILRAREALRLAALAYGETGGAERVALSALERATLERISVALAAQCVALCGTLGPSSAEAPERAAHDVRTYFEVRTLGADPVALGFGMSADPPQEIGASLSAGDLAGISLEGRVALARGSLDLAGFARLRPGMTLALETPLDAPAELHFGGVPFARGVAGTRGARNAFVLGP